MEWRRVGLLVALGVVLGSAGGQESKACSSGGQCFPDGFVPDGVTPSDQHYYCCLDRNMTRHSNNLPDGSVNCTCLLDLELDKKIEEWADSTSSDGRMCLPFGSCPEKPKHKTGIGKFFYCCPDSWITGNEISYSDITAYDGDMEEYIGCRCHNTQIPKPLPGAYVVPHTSLYNSSGESCSYNRGCDDRPYRTCGGLFCCYGSRGIVTSTGANNYTSCTCTNQLYGQQCDSHMIAAPGPGVPCLTDCRGRPSDDVCMDDVKDVRCCPPGFKVKVTLKYYKFNTCGCVKATSHDCGKTSSASGLVPTLTFTLLTLALTTLSVMTKLC